MPSVGKNVLQRDLHVQALPVSFEAELEYGPGRSRPEPAQRQHAWVGPPLCHVQLTDAKQEIAVANPGLVSRTALDDVCDQIVALKVGRNEDRAKPVVLVRVRPSGRG